MYMYMQCFPQDKCLGWRSASVVHETWVSNVHLVIYIKQCFSASTLKLKGGAHDHHGTTL